MNHFSLLAANRITEPKVVVALVCATLVVGSALAV
jgi:hypothetical protein